MSFTNRDLLEWFSAEERHECGQCGERAVVSLPDALASFCLVCGLIWVDGVQIDIEGRVPASSRADR